MNRRNVGLLMTIIGSALGAWWLTQRSRTSRPTPRTAHQRGTVIFDNTPHASDTDAVI